MPPKRGRKPKAIVNGVSGMTTPARPKIPQPAEPAEVDQQQGQDLILCLTTAIVSMVAWARNIFNDDYEPFGYGKFDFNDPDASCESYMKAVNFKVNEPKSPTADEFPRLVRTQNDAANKMIGWLEFSVADVLNKQYLASLQLGFYEGAIIPTNLIEAYIVNITYDNGVATMQVNTESRLGIRAGPRLSNVKQDWMMIIKNLRRRVQGLEDLPAQCKVNMSLIYNDSAPDGYHPPGFRKCADPRIIIDTKGSEEMVGYLDTGLQKVQVGLYKKESVVFKSQPSRMPGRYNSLVENEPLPFLSEEYQQQLALRDMARPVRHSSGWNTQDTVRLPVRTPSEVRGLSLSPSSPLREFSPGVIAQLKAYRAKGKFQQDEVVKPEVSCECGNLDEEDTLRVQCIGCLKYQHKHCYGYVGEPPSHWVCYTCLLKDEDSLLEEMGELCRYRRALFYVWEKQTLADQEAVTALALHLGCEVVETKDLLERMKNEGLLKRSRHKPIHKYIGTPTNFRKHIDPTEKIENHFSISQLQPTTPPDLQPFSIRATPTERTAQSNLRRGIDDTAEDSITEGEASPPPRSLGHLESQAAARAPSQDNLEKHTKRKRTPDDTMGNSDDSGKRLKISESTLDSPSPWGLGK